MTKQAAGSVTRRESVWTLSRIADEVESFIDEHRRPGYLDWFRSHRRVVESWFAGPIDKVTTDTIDAFQRAQQPVVDGHKTGVSDSTLLHRLRCLSLILKEAKRRKIIQGNPLDDVRKPSAKDVDGRRQKDIDCFTRNEVEAIVSTIRESGRHRDADVIHVLFLTGLRRSELARLRLDDVRDGVMWIDGKRRNESMPVSPKAAEMLANVLPIQAWDISQIFRRWKDRLEEPRLHPHAMRHSFVTFLVEQGFDIDAVKRYARHRNISTTQLYIHRKWDDAAAVHAALVG